MLCNIPQELRNYKQWICWKYQKTRENKKATKVPFSPITGFEIGHNSSELFGSFEEACKVSHMFNGVGFFLTKEDPFSFIDLDDTNGNQEILNFQKDVYNRFDSYSEVSPSGNGLHIIVKGEVPSGVNSKQYKTEIYSNMRYMTMTGCIYRNAQIKDCNQLLNVLHKFLKPAKIDNNLYYSGLAAPKYKNEEIIAIATTATNSEKFNDLFFDGNWQKYYPSQSEADFALVNILAFYSENKAQIQELFLSSKLGQREKSRAPYRIKYMLDRCFDNKLPPVDITEIKQKIETIIKKPEDEKEQKKPKPEKKVTFATPPPGIIGELAQYIYKQSPRPVAEIALVGAIGLIAGIVGRAYNISGTGLNQFILVLGQTGVGKEAIAKGIDKLMAEVIKAVPSATSFIGPGEIASGQALAKYLSGTSNSFVSVVGEFGLYLQQMASINAPPYLASLRRTLLDLYNKSGESNVVRPSIYSDKQNNTNAILAPAVTILGESTPEKFYEGLHEGMISEGLLPRFLIVEYYGNRSALNESHLHVKPTQELIEKMSALCAHAQMLNSQDRTIQVQSDKDSIFTFKQFDKYCDRKINNSEREIRRQLWNRAHIKALKLAALVAVGYNPFNPIITVDVAKWSIELIMNDVENMLKRFERGEIGVVNEESNQIDAMVKAIKEYAQGSWEEIRRYLPASCKLLFDDRVIPLTYLMRRLVNVRLFSKDRRGATLSIKLTIKTLQDTGYIQELSKADISKKYGTTSVSYAITNLNILE